MRITPQAIQDLLDELEASKQARLRAWAILQDFRAVLTGLANAKIKPPLKKTFDAEGAILKEALIECLSQHPAAWSSLRTQPKGSINPRLDPALSSPGPTRRF